MSQTPFSAVALSSTLVTALLLTGTRASAKPGFPYNTKIVVGDNDAATIMFGDQAETGVPGKDVIPAFSDIKSYDKYYRYADSQDGAKHAQLLLEFSMLRDSGYMEVLPVGQKVTVLEQLDDPEAPTYPICRIRFTREGSTSTRLVICVSLDRAP